MRREEQQPSAKASASKVPSAIWYAARILRVASRSATGPLQEHRAQTMVRRLTGMPSRCVGGLGSRLDALLLLFWLQIRQVLAATRKTTQRSQPECLRAHRTFQTSEGAWGLGAPWGKGGSRVKRLRLHVGPGETIDCQARTQAPLLWHILFLFILALSTALEANRHVEASQFLSSLGVESISRPHRPPGTCWG